MAYEFFKNITEQWRGRDCFLILQKFQFNIFGKNSCPIQNLPQIIG